MARKLYRICILTLMVALVTGACVKNEDLLVNGISVVRLGTNEAIPMIATDEDGNLLAPYVENDLMTAAVYLPVEGPSLIVWNNSEKSNYPDRAKLGSDFYVFNN